WCDPYPGDIANLEKRRRRAIHLKWMRQRLARYQQHRNDKHGQSATPDAGVAHSRAQVASSPRRQAAANSTRYGIGRLIAETDRGEAAAVILLAALTSAPIAKKQLLFRRGVVPRPFDRSQAEPAQAIGDIAGKIKQRAVLSPRRLEK